MELLDNKTTTNPHRFTIHERVSFTFWGEPKTGTVSDNQRPGSAMVFVICDGSGRKVFVHANGISLLE